MNPLDLENLEVGDVVAFKGYTDENPAPVLQPCQLVRVTEVREPGSYMVVALDDPNKTDNLFSDEIDHAPTVAAETESAAAEAPVEAVAEAPAPKKRGRPSKKDHAARLAAQAPEYVAEATEAADAIDASLAEETVDDTAVEAPITTPGLVPERLAEAETVPGVLRFTEGEGDTATVVVLHDSESVRRAIETEGGALVAVKRLVDQAEQTDFTLGGVLAHVYYERTYEQVSERYRAGNGFRLYTEEVLGVHYRKAMHLKDIYVGFRRHGFDEADLARVGWSKAKEILPYMTDDNAPTLLAAAENHTRAALVETLHENYVRVGETEEDAAERVTRLTVKAVFTGDMATAVKAAIANMKTRLGTTASDQMAVEAIISQWVLDNSEGEEIPLSRAIEHVEIAYGVKLSVVDGETSQETAPIEEAA
jgi:hypothetical protein